MKKIIIAICFILAAANIKAQVVLNPSVALDNKMEQWIATNKMNPTVKGWKIQIITTSDRREMEQAMAKFNTLYPYIDVEWEHIVPYYKVKAGAYEKKMDLMGFLLQLKEDFPSVIPVRENIPKAHFAR